MVHRARRSRPRVGRIGRVARARTLDARALTTRELSLRRAKPRLERGASPCAPSAREASRSSSACRAAAGRAARSARPRALSERSTVRLPDHCVTADARTRFADWSADATRPWPRQSRHGADAFRVRVEARNPEQTVKISNFGDVPGFYPHRQTNRNPAFPCALCTKVHNSATRVHRPARARIRRTRRHPRTSGERRSVWRDCRRRAGSARVDGRAHGVHRRSYLKAELSSRTLSAGA